MWCSRCSLLAALSPAVTFVIGTAVDQTWFSSCFSLVCNASIVWPSRTQRSIEEAAAAATAENLTRKGLGSGQILQVIPQIKPATSHRRQVLMSTWLSERLARAFCNSKDFAKAEVLLSSYKVCREKRVVWGDVLVVVGELTWLLCSCTACSKGKEVWITVNDQMCTEFPLSLLWIHNEGKKV